MMDCLDTGTIQAFLDGELPPAMASSVSAHIAACDACAGQLAAAEEETAFVFSTLEREMDVLVPTQRLWSKINDSIVVEKRNAPFWKKAWAYITVSLANPSMVGAAAVLVAFAVFAGVLINRTGNAPTETAAVVATQQTRTSTTAVATQEPQAPNADDIDRVAEPSLRETQNAAPPVSYASYGRSNRSAYNDMRQPSANAVKTVYIPGEESYVKTITTLAHTVQNQKETVLRPSERVSFEKDMAVVNDAIQKMRKEVRRNPKNESARQVLYTSYQNKIDLLNSVSQREELVASLKD
jgi:hypothetical protein